MKDFKILEMDLDLDKPQISNWDTVFAGTPEYETIEWFVLENHLLKDLAEVIETQYEIYEIDDYLEIKKAFIIKDNKDEILGFLICSAYQVADISSDLYLQYIVVNPTKQHQGYGTEIQTEFFKNIDKYLGFVPTDVHALVNRRNVSSINLFKKLGFTFSRHSRSYLRADNDFYSIHQILNEQNSKQESLWQIKTMT